MEKFTLSAFCFVDTHCFQGRMCVLFFKLLNFFLKMRQKTFDVLTQAFVYKNRKTKKEKKNDEER